jgi:nitrilase
VTMRHHALEAGCFVVNATGWLTEEQIQSLHPDPKLQKAMRDGCMTCIISPEGRHLADPLTEGEGILIADLDMKLITKRKRMMDSVGHYARPELLHLVHDTRPAETRVAYGSAPAPQPAIVSDSDEKEPSNV